MFPPAFFILGGVHRHGAELFLVLASSPNRLIPPPMKDLVPFGFAICNTDDQLFPSTAFFVFVLFMGTPPKRHPAFLEKRQRRVSRITSSRKRDTLRNTPSVGLGSLKW